MSEGKGYRPNYLERIIFGLLGLWNFLVGLYAVSPYYLNTDLSGNRPTLREVLESDSAVHIFGALLIVDGVALLYSAFRPAGTRWYISILSNALLFGFLLRVYSTVGTTVPLTSWRPPVYIAPAILGLFYGVLYVWVRISDRFTE